MRKNLLENIFQGPGHIGQADMDAYLRGDAPPDVVRRVEHAMLDDELCSDAVEGYKEMGLNALPALEDFSEFKKKLPDLGGAKVVPIRPARRWVSIAMAAVLVLFAVVSYFAWESSPSGQNLFAEYYDFYENDISLTRRGDTSFQLEPNLKTALGTYAKGDYVAAIADFEKSLLVEPGNEATLFFLGMAYLENDQPQAAITHFEVAGVGSGTYARKAHWYAILTALKLGEMEHASDLLDAFLDGKGYKEAEAKKLRAEF